MQSVGMCPMCTSDDALVPAAVKPASTLVLMLLGEVMGSLCVTAI